MKTALTKLEMRRAGTLDEALRLMRDEGPLWPLAGCTDAYVQLEFGQLLASRFLDVSRLRELRGIEAMGDGLRIGAGATYTEMIRSPLVQQRLPMLVAAAREVGGVQIQNRGTLGGNAANGSPAGDSLPVLAAAVVVIRSVDGERRVPFTRFHTGYRASVLTPDELIVAFEIPPVEGEQWFRKVGTRAAQAISKVVMAAVKGPAPRIAIGSVAATVVRAVRTEQALAGGAPIAEAQRIFGEEIAPIDDIRSTADYRRQVAINLLRRWWEGR
jgi:xanthine dehydrogenase small subunit